MLAKQHRGFGILEPDSNQEACSFLYAIPRRHYLAGPSMSPKERQIPHLSPVAGGSSSELNGYWQRGPGARHGAEGPEVAVTEQAAAENLAQQAE